MPAATSSGLVAVAEDALSMAVARRLLAHACPGVEITLPRVTAGVGRIKADFGRYLAASPKVRHVVMVDLDRAPCPAGLKAAWGIPQRHDGLVFVVAVRETEAWLLADRSGFAAFVGVPVAKVPARPEEEPDPKQTLVNIVRRSPRKRLAQEIVPEQGSRVSIGPLYNETLSRFVADSWDVGAAADTAPSLNRALQRLGALKA